MEYINLNLQNIDDENICCAINSKKDLRGVEEKKKWILNKILFKRLLDKFLYYMHFILYRQWSFNFDVL